MAPSLVEDRVDTSQALFGALDFNKVDGFQETRRGHHHGPEEDSPCCGDDLTTSTMDGIRVEGNIVDVKPNTTHVLIAQDTLR